MTEIRNNPKHSFNFKFETKDRVQKSVENIFVVRKSKSFIKQLISHMGSIPNSSIIDVAHQTIE